MMYAFKLRPGLRELRMSLVWISKPIASGSLGMVDDQDKMVKINQKFVWEYKVI